MDNKGQTWAMDLVIAVVVFGFMAVIFYSIVIIQQQPSAEDLEKDAEYINTRLEQGVGSCGPIVEGQAVTQDQLQCLFGMDYNQLKTELGVESEFCIYLETPEGTLYIVRNDTTNMTGFGNPELVISGTACGQPVTT